MRFAIVRFPGTWSDRDCHHALHNVLHQETGYVWHRDSSLEGYDAVVLPGGFSYGDYLRCGAIARFSPIMDTVVEFARQGRPVIGICNGFQVLCEAGLLPGVLMRNQSLQFRCDWTWLRREPASSPWLERIEPGECLRIPISHGEGNYQADEATLDQLEDSGRIAFRYVDAAGSPTAGANPNGSARNIAGIVNECGNVLGMMPHPERAAEALTGGADGNRIWEGLLWGARVAVT